MQYSKSRGKNLCTSQWLVRCGHALVFTFSIWEAQDPLTIWNDVSIFIADILTTMEAYVYICAQCVRFSQNMMYHE